MSSESTQIRAAEPAAQSDAELWRRMSRDRTAALGAIYDRHASLVYGLALAILANPQEAEDLAQEVFVALCDGSGFDPSRGSLGAFLSVVTRSRAIDRLRRRARRTRLLEELGGASDGWSGSEPGSPLERSSSMECAREVSQALAELPERQRRALELAYFRGLTQTEIAAELDTPLGTVKSQMRAGLRKLRDALDHLVG